MELSIRLNEEVARELLSGAPRGRDAVGLAEAARIEGLSLLPVHPGTDDAALATFFHASVADASAANAAIERLKSCPGVEAAYLKPREEAPS